MNWPSFQSLPRLGMTKEATLREVVKKWSVFEDMCVWTRFREAHLAENPVSPRNPEEGAS